jgi:hypothetical protein
MRILTEGALMKAVNLSRGALSVAALALAGLAGCMDRTTIFDNPDPNLRMAKHEFRSDALDRFPYKAEAPKLREQKARAQVRYQLNRLEVVNFSETDWQDVDVWVNGKYVCHVPKMENRNLKEIHFPMLFDDQGNSFPMNSNKGKMLVKSVEIFRDGKMYQVTVEAAGLEI